MNLKYKSWLPSLPRDINKLTPDEALILAKTKYKPGMIVESLYSPSYFFVIKEISSVYYHIEHKKIYFEGMCIFELNTQKWARIISGPKESITKEQKEHIVNLIKSI